MKQAYYHDSFESFLQTKNEEIIGKLNLGITSYVSQWTIGITSWENSIEIYKKTFRQLIALTPSSANWSILLEYEIPRLASRIDAVIIADDLIFVIEFKYDRNRFELADLRQAEDYALDLNDFHLESRDRKIIPILLAPKANSSHVRIVVKPLLNVQQCLKANEDDLVYILNSCYSAFHDNLSKAIDPLKWEHSEYQPTPTIIQAAKALFAGQKVEDISKTGADSINLTKTTKFLIEAIKEARIKDKKIICFVTGVPGAGKTLVGLNIIHEKEEFGGDDFNTAYFSGNGPLINVLREALSRDHLKREIQLYKPGQIRPTKGLSKHKIKAKIQNLHLFIKGGIRKQTPPDERIVVFDEAQRCWDATHFYNKSKQNENRERNAFEIVKKPEAELLFDIMNRHEGWAVIIALVGGGQEINTGEAGIAEWGKVIESTHSNWEVYISPELLIGGSSTSGQTLFKDLPKNVIVHKNEDLHLKVSQRSFRTDNLNAWVNAVIDNNPKQALELASSLHALYPIFITRDIEKAKQWLKDKITGTKRIGLVASSGGLRLKPYGINVREELDEALWFLNDEKDIRSSYYLELVATEFKVQGLELDWVGICWDADLRRRKDNWDFKRFSGTHWQNSNSKTDHQFVLNTYRVLMTRAREGIIIFVPEGSEQDETRLPEFYTPIYDYLKVCGLVEI